MGLEAMFMHRSRRAIRLFGFGLSTSILVLHLRFDLGWSDVYIGSFISVTLLGNAVMALLVTQLIPFTGQRRMLSAGPLGMVLSGLIFYKSSSPALLLLASVLGVISPVANEVSPYQAVDIAVLSQLVPDSTRVQIFTSYMFVGAISSSIGGVVTGAVIHHYLPLVGASEAYRRVFLVFSAGGLLALLASFAVSSKANLPSKAIPAKDEPDENSPLLPDQPTNQAKPVEQPAVEESPKITARFGVPIVLVLSVVSGVDTFASAIASPSYIAYDLKDRFNPPIQTITNTISLCGLLAGISFLIAAPLARRAGVLRTMICSHIIAQIFLISYGLATNMHLSIILVLIRASFAVLEMPPRTAFYSSIIAPEDRARHLGYINLARTLTAAAGPLVDGWLAAKGVIWLAFIASGMLKLIAYDGGLSLFFAFRQKKEVARA